MQVKSKSLSDKQVREVFTFLDTAKVKKFDEVQKYNKVESIEDSTVFIRAESGSDFLEVSAPF